MQVAAGNLLKLVSFLPLVHFIHLNRKFHDLSCKLVAMVKILQPGDVLMENPLNTGGGATKTTWFLMIDVVGEEIYAVLDVVG